jgi:hypothetical protein
MSGIKLIIEDMCLLQFQIIILFTQWAYCINMFTINVFPQ